MGSFPGLLGFRGQSMSLPRKESAGHLLYAASSLTPGAGSFTATTRCEVEAGINGAGGSGSDLSAAAGDGGGAAYKRFKMSRGQTFSWVVGSGGAAPLNSDGSTGGDTILTLPNGEVILATGGGGGGGPPGVGIGGDINRTGGSGGSSGGAGASGEQGGLGSAGGAGNSGGGGAAGFNDFAPLFRAGSGGVGATTTGVDPGGGGGGSTGGGGTSGRGGHGGIYFIVSSIRDS